MLLNLLFLQPVESFTYQLGGNSGFNFFVVLITLIISYFHFRHKDRYGIWQDKKFPHHVQFTKENLTMAYIAISISMIFYNRRNETEKIRLLRQFIRERNNKVPADFDTITDIFLLSPIHPIDTAKWIQKHAKEGTKKVLMEFLVKMCLSDKMLDPKEYNALKVISLHFQISTKELDEWVAKYSGRKTSSSYSSSNSSSGRKRHFEQHSSVRTETLREKYAKVLNISAHASQEEVKKSYRTLVKQYHPDRFAKASKVQQEEVHRKFLEIQKAYEYLSSK